jgi:hypothetical protein
MQIHEITHRPVNEVLGTMAAGVGKALANKFVSSQLPGINAFDKDKTQTTGTTASAPAAQQLPAADSASTPDTPAAPTPTVNYNIPAVQRTAAARSAATSVQQPVQGWQGQNINVPAAQRKQAAQAAQVAQAATTVAPAAGTAQPTPAPNFGQGGYAATTTNAPAATVPTVAARPAARPAATPAATPAAPLVNPAKPPQVYTFDGRALDPGNANDARIIKTLQSQGVTSGRTNPKPSASAQTTRSLQDLRQTAIRTGDRDYLRQVNQRLGLPLDSTT